MQNDENDKHEREYLLTAKLMCFEEVALAGRNISFGKTSSV